MPLPGKFQSYLSKAEQKINQQVHSRFPNAPPIPNFSKPQSPQQQQQQQQQEHPDQAPPPPQHPNAACYWNPSFHGHEPASTHFAHETGQTGWGNNEAQNYTDSSTNSFHSPDGALVLHAHVNHSHPDGSQRVTSARLTSRATLGRCRGYVGVRITAPVAEGVWPAFWLLPQDPFTWPYDGEVDIFEAWNGDPTNHACLHWGHFNGEDHDKHRVVESALDVGRLTNQREGVGFGFAWDEDESNGQGRLVWYIDGRPVMKAGKPPGTRKMSEFRILINVAVGGNVCQGKMPRDGRYEMVVRDLGMWEEPPGGWGRFESDFHGAKEGHMM